MPMTPATKGILAAKHDDDIRDIAIEAFDYLDALRASGVTNMMGAIPYIQDEFSFPKDAAKKMLTAWMHTFSHDLTASERVTIAGERELLPTE